jgi:anaerobic selenocysteine-containing dehydrogenase
VTTTSYATCSLCDAICGIAVEHDGDRIVSIKGDVDDPFSKGHVCPKVMGLKHIHEDPDRVRSPLKRSSGGEFHEVTWDEALGEASERLARLQRAHGNDAVALYVGNPTAHSYSASLMVPLFLRAMATRNAFSATSMDSLPRLLASQLVYGSPLVIPVPDLDRTSLLVVLGANPVVSNGSMMTAPGVKKRLLAIKERGGRVVVIDPRRTETAEIASEHHFIRPGSDALFLASMVHVLATAQLLRPAPYVDGVDAVREAVAPFAPERTAAATGIPAEVVHALARSIAHAKGGAAIHARMGASTQEGGALNCWLVDVIHALTGHLDREGGMMFPLSPVPIAQIARRLGVDGLRGRWKSRVRGLPEFNGELPIATFAEEMEAGHVRGLVTFAGNPALSAPHSARIGRGLRGLETMVSIDIYVNETSRHAHFILPPTFGLENDHFPLLFHGLAVRNTAHYSRAVLPKAPNAREDWQILGELSSRVIAARAGRVAGAAVRALVRAMPPKRALALLLRTGPYRLSLDALDVHGVDLGPLMPGALRGKRIDLAQKLFLDELARRAHFDETDGLVLIGRRDLRSNNSFMHNVENLVRGERRCTLLMHPRDAAERGVVDGAVVRVTSRVGELDVEAQLTDAMMPGVVSLPHGWGHDAEGARMSVARKNPGVNLNILTDDEHLDPVSGCVVLNGVPVRVSLRR